jgi:hypothetical protein
LAALFFRAFFLRDFFAMVSKPRAWGVAARRRVPAWLDNRHPGPVPGLAFVTRAL